MNTFHKGFSHLGLANHQGAQTRSREHGTANKDPFARSDKSRHAYLGQAQLDEGTDEHEIAVLAEQDLKRRELRYRSLGPDLGSDLSWAILLHLLAAGRQEIDASIQSICQDLLIPLPTASRWVAALAHEDLIGWRSTNSDQHNALLSLTRKGKAAVISILENYR